MHELAGRLARRGNHVRVLTGTPRGLVGSGQVDGVPVRYVRTPRLPRWPEPGPGFAAASLAGSLLARADVVHCLHYVDAAGAARGRTPVILKLTGTVLPDRVSGLDARLFQSAIERSAEVWVNSTWALNQMTSYDVPMRVVPAGVDTNAFLPGTRSEQPLVVCAAAGDEPRKRLVDLLDAWPGVRAVVPDAELVLAGRGHPAELPTGARSVGELAPEAMADLYARAWCVVAPAVYEALGLVTLEALASGTPVAGADSGATPELLSAPGVGALAQPGSADALADAVTRAIALASDATTAERCRAVALPYDWDAVVPQVLAGYDRVVR